MKCERLIQGTRPSRRCKMLDFNIMLQKKALFYLMVPSLSLCFIYKFLLPLNDYEFTPIYNINSSEYLIYNSKCRIPNTDPFNKEVEKLYVKKDYVPCSKLELLTYVVKNGNDTEAFLHINQTLVGKYSKNGVKCCYSNVTRDGHSDNKVSISKCTNFEKKVKLPDNAVLVTCTNPKTKKEVYGNVHHPITISDKVRQKITDMKTAQPNAFSVLFIGIDSVSRLNMLRDLPHTRQYLTNHNWLEMQTYNKMGDNTFPNLMAILTGRNLSSSYKNCDPTKENKLDECNFVWNDYRRLGYVSGYAEDTASISTFNYNKKGFYNEPADYYFRPMILAAELKLKKVVVDEMVYCAGPETSGERILNAANDFVVTFKDTPSFGFFWMNSFSHNKLNALTRMDEKIEEFFETIEAEGILDNTIVLFLSDHGLRFGEILKTYTGWLEERLPMFFVWIPPKFRESFPQEYANIRANGNRLTNPYDLHMTLQDVLIYSGANYSTVPSEGCPTCKSFFKEIESERSCEDAYIDWHWCACPGYTYIDKSNETVQGAARHIVDNVNMQLSEAGFAKKCAKFKVNEVVSSRISVSVNGWYKNYSYVLVVLNTSPSAVFEATVRINNNASEPFTIEQGLSRVDRYASHSNCMNDSFWKTLCYCV